MLKSTLLFLPLFCCFLQASAQDKRDLRLGIEAGPILFSDAKNIAFFLNSEIKLKAAKRAFIGLRIGLTVNSQSVTIYNPSVFKIDEDADNGALSFVPTFDYYLNDNKYRPYFGVGVGYFVLAASVDVTQLDRANFSEELFVVDVKDKVGFLFRGGIESGKFRFGAEYNLLFKADLILPTDEKIGVVDNSYFGLSVGYIFGAGKNVN